eukprot:TRINITY_DN28893_c0_g3_i1.p1 TRINITY_DN28893_c0_g3~~TRINITY_DN28893_c0_g3_i1.p1  ORF type:complete len:2650 (-),score=544.36 TRINITY_DN28893_c0_g3_i1:178-8127(-)
MREVGRSATIGGSEAIDSPSGSATPSEVGSFRATLAGDGRHGGLRKRDVTGPLGGSRKANVKNSSLHALSAVPEDSLIVAQRYDPFTLRHASRQSPLTGWTPSGSIRKPLGNRLGPPRLTSDPRLAGRTPSYPSERAPSKDGSPAMANPRSSTSSATASHILGAMQADMSSVANRPVQPLRVERLRQGRPLASSAPSQVNEETGRGQEGMPAAARDFLNTERVIVNSSTGAKDCPPQNILTPTGEQWVSKTLTSNQEMNQLLMHREMTLVEMERKAQQGAAGQLSNAVKLLSMAKTRKLAQSWRSRQDRGHGSICSVVSDAMYDCRPEWVEIRFKQAALLSGFVISWGRHFAEQYSLLVPAFDIGIDNKTALEQEGEPHGAPYWLSAVAPSAFALPGEGTQEKWHVVHEETHGQGGTDFIRFIGGPVVAKGIRIRMTRPGNTVARELKDCMFSIVSVGAVPYNAGSLGAGLCSQYLPEAPKKTATILQESVTPAMLAGESKKSVFADKSMVPNMEKLAALLQEASERAEVIVHQPLGISGLEPVHLVTRAADGTATDTANSDGCLGPAPTSALLAGGLKDNVPSSDVFGTDMVEEPQAYAFASYTGFLRIEKAGVHELLIEVDKPSQAECRRFSYEMTREKSDRPPDPFALLLPQEERRKSSDGDPSSPTTRLTVFGGGIIPADDMLRRFTETATTSDHVTLRRQMHGSTTAVEVVQDIDNYSSGGVSEESEDNIAVVCKVWVNLEALLPMRQSDDEEDRQVLRVDKDPLCFRRHFHSGCHAIAIEVRTDIHEEDVPLPKLRLSISGESFGDGPVPLPRAVLAPPASANATLSFVAVLPGAASGLAGFDPSCRNYQVPMVPYEVEEIRILATTTRPQGRAFVYSQGFLGDQEIEANRIHGKDESRPLRLNIGDTKIFIRVLAEDLKTRATYTLTVVRDQWRSCHLRELAVSTPSCVGEICYRSFDLEHRSTSAAAQDMIHIPELPYMALTATVTATARNPHALIYIAKGPSKHRLEEEENLGTSGEPHRPINLHVGRNIVYVRVLSPDRQLVMNWNLVVNRHASSDATLKTINIEPCGFRQFLPSADEYLVPEPVSSGCHEVDVWVEANHDDAKLYVSHNDHRRCTVKRGQHRFDHRCQANRAMRIPLRVGWNTIFVRVVAMDNTTSKTYAFQLVRRPTPLLQGLLDLGLGLGLECSVGEVHPSVGKPRGAKEAEQPGYDGGLIDGSSNVGIMNPFCLQVSDATDEVQQPKKLPSPAKLPSPLWTLEAGDAKFGSEATLQPTLSEEASMQMTFGTPLLIAGLRMHWKHGAQPDFRISCRGSTPQELSRSIRGRVPTCMPDLTGLFPGSGLGGLPNAGVSIRKTLTGQGESFGGGGSITVGRTLTGGTGAGRQSVSGLAGLQVPRGMPSGTSDGGASVRSSIAPQAQQEPVALSKPATKPFMTNSRWRVEHKADNVGDILDQDEVPGIDVSGWRLCGFGKGNEPVALPQLVCAKEIRIELVIDDAIEEDLVLENVELVPLSISQIYRQVGFGLSSEFFCNDPQRLMDGQHPDVCALEPALDGSDAHCLSMKIPAQVCGKSWAVQYSGILDVRDPGKYSFWVEVQRFREDQSLLWRLCVDGEVLVMKEKKEETKKKRRRKGKRSDKTSGDDASSCSESRAGSGASSPGSVVDGDATNRSSFSRGMTRESRSQSKDSLLGGGRRDKRNTTMGSVAMESNDGDRTGRNSFSYAPSACGQSVLSQSQTGGAKAKKDKQRRWMTVNCIAAMSGGRKSGKLPSAMEALLMPGGHYVRLEVLAMVSNDEDQFGGYGMEEDEDDHQSVDSGACAASGVTSGRSREQETDLGVKMNLAYSGPDTKGHVMVVPSTSMIPPDCLQIDYDSKQPSLLRPTAPLLTRVEICEGFNQAAQQLTSWLEDEIFLEQLHGMSIHSVQQEDDYQGGCQVVAIHNRQMHGCINLRGLRYIEWEFKEARVPEKLLKHATSFLSVPSRRLAGIASACDALYDGSVMKQMISNCLLVWYLDLGEDAAEQESDLMSDNSSPNSGPATPEEGSASCRSIQSLRSARSGWSEGGWRPPKYQVLHASGVESSPELVVESVAAFLRDSALRRGDLLGFSVHPVRPAGTSKPTSADVAEDLEWIILYVDPNVDHAGVVEAGTTTPLLHVQGSVWVTQKSWNWHFRQMCIEESEVLTAQSLVKYASTTFVRDGRVHCCQIALWQSCDAEMTQEGEASEDDRDSWEASEDEDMPGKRGVEQAPDLLVNVGNMPRRASTRHRGSIIGLPEGVAKPGERLSIDGGNFELFFTSPIEDVDNAVGDRRSSSATTASLTTIQEPETLFEAAAADTASLQRTPATDESQLPKLDENDEWKTPLADLSPSTPRDPGASGSPRFEASGAYDSEDVGLTNPSRLATAAYLQKALYPQVLQEVQTLMRGARHYLHARLYLRVLQRGMPAVEIADDKEEIEPLSFFGIGAAEADEEEPDGRTTPEAPRSMPSTPMQERVEPPAAAEERSASCSSLAPLQPLSRQPVPSPSQPPLSSPTPVVLADLRLPPVLPSPQLSNSARSRNHARSPEDQLSSPSSSNRPYDGVLDGPILPSDLQHDSSRASPSSPTPKRTPSPATFLPGVPRRTPSPGSSMPRATPPSRQRSPFDLPR